MRKLFIVSLVVIAGYVPASGQNTALRYIAGEVHKIYDKPAFDNFCMGVGLDRTFNSRLTVGFDITYDIASVLQMDNGRSLSVTSGGHTATYFVNKKMLSLNYHTEYALADNDGTHVYIGTYIGLRHITQNWVDDSYYNYSNITYTSFPQRVSASKVLIPLGLRIGVRGPVDEGFLDLYAQLGYQIGGGENLYPRYPVLAKADFTQPSSLVITMGLAYGIGW
ncbi:MAG: hypothetical protein WBO28_13300 [Flavobacteriales bacterium]